MGAAHSFFVTLTVLILTSAVPLVPANASPSSVAESAIPDGANAGTKAGNAKARAVRPTTRTVATRAVRHVPRNGAADGRLSRADSHTRNVGPRPAAWCGWWMRTQKGGGPELNLARNWAKWGRPSGPQVGAVVVWPHHVGMITGRTSSGQWIVKSGNDDGQVRERPRNVSGAVFRVG